MDSMIIAMLWDFDGVVVLTPHEEAWRLAAAKYGIDNFTSEFYYKFVAGRPRFEGARAILEHFGLLDKLDDISRDRLIESFAEEKNRIFNELISRGLFSVNHEALEFIARTRILTTAKFVHVLASASKNAARLSRSIKVEGRMLYEFFDIDVSGSSTSKKGVFAAGRGVVGSADCFIAIDDAPSGIEAARELGLIPIGFQNKDLVGYGARLVIERFRDLDPGVLINLCL
ncbi:MAG: hypothetical protein DJ555_00470 [Desulfurococcaceae archaeon]|nr:MAG: hypothetical protein DJ555_00470 [Desulfurococcaceae archaeon]